MKRNMNTFLKSVLDFLSKATLRWAISVCMPFRNSTGITQMKTNIYIFYLKKSQVPVFFCLFYNYASGIIQVELKQVNGKKSWPLHTQGLHRTQEMSEPCIPSSSQTMLGKYHCMFDLFCGVFFSLRYSLMTTV